MPYSNLRSYLNALEVEGELHRVKAEVDPELEITEIATRVVKQKGPALLFERVKGSPYPVAINMLASPKRIEMALGRHPAALGDEIKHFLEQLSPPSIGAFWEHRGFLHRLLSFRLAKARKKPCQEVIEQSPDLSTLPVLKCWPQDGGRFLTLPMVYTQDPDSGHRNLGMYRIQIFSKYTTGMHWQIQKGGAFHYHQAEKRGEPLEAAIVLGGDPLMILCAAMPLPDGMDELMFSGLLRHEATRMMDAKTINLRVPANADFIIEGVVPPFERAMEGPFGDHLGHYSEAAPFPVFHVRAITRRKNPIYPATVVGIPPQEDCYMVDAIQELLMPFIKITHSGVHDLWAYSDAGFHNLLVAAVRRRYDMEPIRIAMGMLGEGQVTLTKCMVLVDPGVDVRDPIAVLRAIRQNFMPEADYLMISQGPLDTLDFTSGKMNVGGKMIVDATSKRPPAESEPFTEDVRQLCPEALDWKVFEDALLVIKVRDKGREVVTRLVQQLENSGIKIIAAVDENTNLNDPAELMWAIMIRFDAVQDVVFSRMELRGSTPAYGGVMGVDATMKPGYSAVLEMAPDIVERVNRRWNEYGL
jgi:menaquinone biosynthesis decarboxylase